MKAEKARYLLDNTTINGVLLEAPKIKSQLENTDKIIAISGSRQMQLLRDIEQNEYSDKMVSIIKKLLIRVEVWPVTDQALPLHIKLTEAVIKANKLRALQNKPHMIEGMNIDFWGVSEAILRGAIVVSNNRALYEASLFLKDRDTKLVLVNWYL